MEGLLQFLPDSRFTHFVQFLLQFSEQQSSQLQNRKTLEKMNQRQLFVTATAHVKIFEAKIRSNLTWHSNMLQTKDLSKKHIRNQKSPPARDDEKRRRRNQSLEHGDVPIFGINTA